MPEQKPMNIDQLRHEIDRGMTGDKVDYPDPAAAPLGTDDEAAGAAPPSGAKSVSLESGVAAHNGRRRLSSGEWVMAVTGAAAIVCAVALLLPVFG
jgi:hypothetical protein